MSSRAFFGKIKRRIAPSAASAAREAHRQFYLAQEVGSACKVWLLKRGIYYDTYTGRQEQRQRGLDAMNGGAR